MRFIIILLDFYPFLGYYLNMKRRKKRKPRQAEVCSTGAGAMASATRGMARRFKDRRKDASKKACRGKVEL
jgi:hypothetical protein